MPMYDFQCEKCGAQEEKFVPVSRADESYVCERWIEPETSPIDPPQSGDNVCKGVCNRVPSFWYTREGRSAQGFSSVVIHRSPDGAIRLPANAAAPVPAGFERVELTNIHEIRKFEHQMNASEAGISRSEANKHADQIQARVEANRAIFNQMKQTFSPRGRAYAEMVQKKTDAKIREIREKGAAGTNFHVDAFSFDSSNREVHRDATNRYGLHGGKNK